MEEKDIQNSKVKNFLAKLLNIKTKEVHINPESVKDHQLIKALQFENAEIKGDRDRAKLELAKLRVGKGDKEEEQEVKLYLNEEKERLEQIKVRDYFSLKKLFEMYFNNPDFSNKLFYTDFERGEKLAKFKDFGISEDGRFVAVGEDENKETRVILEMYNLKEMFQSIRGLKNDVPAGKIPLNIDKDGAWIENLLDYDIPEVQRVGQGLQYFKARKRPVYEIIQEKNSRIGQLMQELEEQEALSHELQQENDNLKRSLSLQEKMTNDLNSEVSEGSQIGSNITRSFNQMLRRVESVTNHNLILEENVEKLESVVEELRDEAEREGSKLNFDRAMEQMKNIRRELVRDEPKVKIVEVPKIIEKQGGGVISPEIK